MNTSADLPSVVTCLKSDDNVHNFQLLKIIETWSGMELRCVSVYLHQSST